MKRAAAGAVLVAVASAGETGPRDYTGYTFEAHLKEHNKSYASFQEYRQREELFKASLENVIKHNEQFKAGDQTWWATMNKLSDMTQEEFGKLRSTKYSPSQHPTLELPQTQANPDSIDWRDHGAVTPVKDQGGCGSCWAFSATESVESHLFIATKKLVKLAPQTYVNCVKNPQQCGGTGGCEGATMELAFNLTVTEGIASEAEIPYTANDDKCKPYKAAAKATGYVKNPVNSAIGLETAIAQKGPVSITVAANSWQMYGGGIFTGCSRRFIFFQDNTLDHGVQAVGYTKDYWIVRNSWGNDWGLNGYIHLSRAFDDQTFTNHHPADGIACKPIPKTQTVGGECGLLFDSSYPTGVTAGASEEIIV